MAKKKKTTRPTKGKTEQGKKLSALRKKMSTDTLKKWHEWSSKNHPTGSMTEVTFNVVTWGQYISKDNIVFANQMLKEGKRLQEEFEKSVKDELKSI